MIYLCLVVSPPSCFELDELLDTGTLKSFEEAAAEVPPVTGWLDVLAASPGFDSGFEGAKDLRNRRRASDIATLMGSFLFLSVLDASSLLLEFELLGFLRPLLAIFFFYINQALMYQ